MRAFGKQQAWILQSATLEEESLFEFLMSGGVKLRPTCKCTFEV